MNLNRTDMKLGTVSMTLVIAIATAITLGLAPPAKADVRGCSNATLRGAFVDQASGFSTSPPELAGPLAGVFLLNFDGKGTMTSAGTLSLGGNPLAVTGQATYSVNSDCTGTYTSQLSPLGSTGHYFFVILDGGNAFKWICTDPGVVLSGVAKRQTAAERDRRD